MVKHIISKSPSSRFGVMGKKFECPYCVAEAKRRIWHLKKHKHDGRGMLVCDKHLEQWLKDFKEGRRMPEPNPQELKSGTIIDQDLLRMKKKVELRLQMNTIMDREFMESLKGKDLVEDKDEDEEE